MSSAARTGGRRRRNAHAGSHENEERWLLTYADMITLLMALFIVLFAISSVNVSKLKSLQQSLRDAFSGRVLDGGQAVLETGENAVVRTLNTSPDVIPRLPSIARPSDAAGRRALAARREEDELQRLKQLLDSYAAAHGFRDSVETVVARRGLVVRLLTDRVLFDSGLAQLKPEGMPLLGQIGNLLTVDRRHPIVVEGHTDDVPISTSQYASNWELSTARATAVVRHLIGRGVPTRRFGASGYADIHPLATNGTAGGRARNRRVEIVLQRLHEAPASVVSAPAATAKGPTP